MNQAVADGAVTPLLYEGRMSELHGDKAQIDKWFERITKDLTVEQKAGLRKKFRREEELSKSEQRLAEIAYGIGQHFKTNYHYSIPRQLLLRCPTPPASMQSSQSNCLVRAFFFNSLCTSVHIGSWNLAESWASERG